MQILNNGKPLRLFRRGRRWTFRAFVPEELRAIIDKREIWKSLGAVSYREALRLSHVESVKADALFAEARAKRAGGTTDDTPASVSDRASPRQPHKRACCN
ncbi:DUF6538 domain-containing protein [Xanthobacter autotrophicus]|uniref:DUF6538 domain-containing protein n=1 Tax=Xanthobacter autotrophicus TaxID=280 RepID=UPI0037283673